jgi:hypothetical protein
MRNVGSLLLVGSKIIDQGAGAIVAHKFTFSFS